jgi:hypothetical protein
MFDFYSRIPAYAGMSGESPLRLTRRVLKFSAQQRRRL